MTKPNGCSIGFVVLMLFAVTAITSPAQTFTTLIAFDGRDGANPLYVSLAQGRDGNYYGTTSTGGGHGVGEVFRITAAGGFHKLAHFDGSNGSNPEVGLVLAPDGNFYGTTGSGGANNGGTVFKITALGRLTTLYNFCVKGGTCTDGDGPLGLVQASNGIFYGLTHNGANGWGTVFTLTPMGKLTTLHRFCPPTHCTDGAAPMGGLIQASDGNFYGVTSTGGVNGFGTVFKITPMGKLTTLYSFCVQSTCPDGAAPFAGLVQASDGNFYGTTVGGGSSNCQGGCGTIFKITSSGNFTLLYSFDGNDGENPSVPLVQATDGNLYGTTTAVAGGFGLGGTIFNITLGGTLSNLHGFLGDDPYGGLLQATNGRFYATTLQGSALRLGTVYSLSMRLGPFVAFVRGRGKVGAIAQILGQGFTGTSGVSFNGTAANFVVHSDTYLTATVPSGATSGFVTVTTPRGTLDSNVPFRVTP